MARSALHGLAAAVVVASGTAMAAPPAKSGLAFGDRMVDSVHAARADDAVVPSTRTAPPRAGRTRCLGVDHVAGAVVFGDRAVELTMTDGARWRMSFAKECPTLSFYQGFYYRRAVAGRLCAGRDAVISRTGGECPIAAITRVSAAKKARRH